jgi:hypothetical protein
MKADAANLSVARADVLPTIGTVGATAAGEG